MERLVSKANVHYIIGNQSDEVSDHNALALDSTPQPLIQAIPKKVGKKGMSIKRV